MTKKQLADVAAGSSFIQEFKLLLWKDTIKITLMQFRKTVEYNILPSEKTLDEIAVTLWDKYFKRNVKISVYRRKKQ